MIFKILLLISLFTNAWGQSRPGGQTLAPKVKTSVIDDGIKNKYELYDRAFTDEITKKFQECHLGNPKAIKNIFELRIRIILHNANKNEIHDYLCPKEVASCLSGPKVDIHLKKLLEDKISLKKYISFQDKNLSDKEIDSMIEFLKSLSVKKDEEH